MAGSDVVMTKQEFKEPLVSTKDNSMTENKNPLADFSREELIAELNRRYTVVSKVINVDLSTRTTFTVDTHKDGTVETSLAALS